MPQMTFGGPKDGRPNPATPGENGPNYGKQIDRWKSALKGDVSKKRQKKLRNKIQGARVDRWSDQVRAQANAPVAHDSIYNDAINQANTDYNQAIINQAQHYSDLREQGGFEAGYNDFAKNPYSRAAQLDAAWKRDQRMTLNSYAAAGQLYSGARERENNRATANYLSDSNTAKGEYEASLFAIGQEEPAAREARANAIDAAGREELQRIADNPPEAAPPPPKFIKKEKRQLKNRIEKLKEQRSEAENKAKRRKITKRIQKTKKNLNSIPKQYSEGKP